MSKVITIGRKYGSAGIEVGKKVAELLNVPFYDKELVEMAAKKDNLNPETVKEVDERATNSLLYSVVSGNYSMRGLGSPMYYNMPINDRLFVAQTGVIKDVAKSDCVIVGRCADYVLDEEENVNVLSVFIYSSNEYCIEHIIEEMGLTKTKARDLINKSNKRRKNYYEYYTGRDWGVMANYDLCIDVEKVGVENAAKLIAECAKMI